MTKLAFHRIRPPAPVFLLALGLAFVPISAFAQNYVFDSAGVYAKASAQADGVAGTGYFDSEQCAPGCTGAKLSAAGFKDTGTAIKMFADADADGTARNKTTATTDAAKGISLSISCDGHAEANTYAPNGYASSPFPYKGEDAPWFDGTNMFMAWKVNKASTLKVTGLKAETTQTVDGGQFFVVASWTITVSAQGGGVIATYTQDVNGSTFNADIPANTVVKISWTARAGAKAAFGPGPTSANVDASVSGSLTIGP
jgi:hypothetical protein